MFAPLQYERIILSFMLNSYETWSLILRGQRWLRVFKNKYPGVQKFWRHSRPLQSHDGADEGPSIIIYNRRIKLGINLFKVYYFLCKKLFTLFYYQTWCFFLFCLITAEAVFYEFNEFSQKLFFIIMVNMCALYIISTLQVPKI